MSDTTDAIQESVAHGRESRLNSRVAVMVAIAATFMALCNIKDGNIVQAMQQAQAHSIDTWSYYQAKSTREAIAENAVGLLETQHGDVTVIAAYQAKIKGYEADKARIKAQAEGDTKEYDDLNIFDDQFDATEALLSIAIAMFGVTALTQKSWLFYFSGAISVLGIFLGLTAFLKISLHSDFLSRILG